MQIVHWVVPYRGVRAFDPFGFGGFGAAREHNGREAKHLGLDLVALVDDTVVAPLSGIYTGPGVVYTHTALLRSLHFTGTGEYHPYKFVLLYVTPNADLLPGATVERGSPVGTAQDVAGYWYSRVHTLDEPWAREMVRRDARMTNHVHGELWVDGTRVNPALHLAPVGVC